MGDVIKFHGLNTRVDPAAPDPAPHFPPAEVREYLHETKSDALLRSRVPSDVADLIARVAFVSNTTPSGLTRMIVTDWAMSQCVPCPPDGGGDGSGSAQDSELREAA